MAPPAIPAGTATTGSGSPATTARGSLSRARARGQRSPLGPTRRWGRDDSVSPMTGGARAPLPARVRRRADLHRDGGLGTRVAIRARMGRRRFAVMVVDDDVSMRNLLQDYLTSK